MKESKKVALSWGYLYFLICAAIVANFVFVKDPWGTIFIFFLLLVFILGLIFFFVALIKVIEDLENKKNAKSSCDNPECNCHEDGMRTR